MNEPGPDASLYGSESAPPPPPKGPGLMDQVTGVFTAPAALFRRLEATPVWGGALALILVLNAVASGIWAKRVDVDAMIRPILERTHPEFSSEQIDAAVSIQQRLIAPGSVVGGAIAITLVFLVMAFIYWLVGKGTAENRPPSFRLAFSATTVSSLVAVPRFILLAIVSALRNIGGTRIEGLSPTSLGFYVVPESPKLQALFYTLDLFTLASLLMVYLAARHGMRLKAAGAAICTAIAGVLTLGLPALFAR